MEDAPLDPNAAHGAAGAQPPVPSSAPAAPGGGGLGPRDPSHDTIIHYLEQDDDPSSLRIDARLRKAIEAALDGARSLALGARLVPVGVRGPERGAALVPAALQLTDAAAGRLGEAPQTHALLGDGELRVWLARLDALPPGTHVTLVALSPDGETLIAHGDVPDEPHAALKLSVPWTDPEAFPLLALVVDSADDDASR